MTSITFFLTGDVNHVLPNVFVRHTRERQQRRSFQLSFHQAADEPLSKQEMTMSNSERECTPEVLTDEQLEIVSGGASIFDPTTGQEIKGCGVGPLLPPGTLGGQGLAIGPLHWKL